MIDDQVMGKILEHTRNKYFGKYRGVVVENNDPMNRGRLEVKVKNLMRDVSFWAMPCLPFGGKDMGIFMVPEKESGVWVEFEGGDLNLPIWTGCYWGDDESPKDNKTDEPKVRLIRSEKGLTISLDDQDEIITISDKRGNNLITIDVNAKKIKVKSADTIVIESKNVLLGGELMTEPVVKGRALMTYLTQLAAAAMPKTPATPPLPPVSELILSTTVQTT